MGSGLKSSASLDLAKERYSEDMKIYLDTSTLNRIFDDRSQLRIALEVKAVESILTLIDSKHLQVYHSDALAYEISKNPYSDRRQIIMKILKRYDGYQPLNPSILERANFLQDNCKLGDIDALHVACAEAMSVDYFITCDDRLIKRYLGSIVLLNPIQFILNLTQEE